MLRLRLLLRQLTVSAPQMTIKRHLPWPLKAAAWLAVLALGAALGTALYDYSRGMLGLNPPISAGELSELRAELLRLQNEVGRLQAALDQAGGQLTIERAQKDQLAEDLRAAQKAMASLREDLSFFETLLPIDSRSEQVSIRAADINREGTGLGYRVLLMRGGRPTQDFKGQIEFVISGVQDGRTLTLPQPVRMALAFRQYHRLEGMLTLPAGFLPRSVTVRVLENGQLRSQRSVNF
jgi:hypothetical protein